MQLTNGWNRFIYRLWAPIYDETVNRLFMPGRRHALDVLDLRAGQRVLIVGVGTGVDLELLPAGVEAVGIDLSPQMLNKARGRLSRSRASVRLVEGDAQAPLLDACTFDAAILNLILSVIPDGNACVRTTLDALKPNARLVVFDKFLPDGRDPSQLRMLINTFSMLLGTDINRRLCDILQGLPCDVLSNEASIAGGLYRVVLLRKRTGVPVRSLAS